MGEFIPHLLLVFIQTLLHMFLNYILGIFASSHIFLEIWRSLMVQNIYILFYFKFAYIQIAKAMSKYDISITDVKGKSCN